MSQPRFSSSALGGVFDGFDGCKTESSLQSLGWRAAAFRSGGGVYALLLERADGSLNHSVLLLAVRRDELLAQTIAAQQGRVITAYKVQALSLRSRNGSFPTHIDGVARDARGKIAAQHCVGRLRCGHLYGAFRLTYTL